MGDEIGMLNDHSYLDDPDHAGDNRWVHRPKMDWGLVADAEADASAPPGACCRASNTPSACASDAHRTPPVESRVLPGPDSRSLLLTREHPEGMLIEVYNFEDVVDLPVYALRDCGSGRPLIRAHQRL